MKNYLPDLWLGTGIPNLKRLVSYFIALKEIKGKITKKVHRYHSTEYIKKKYFFCAVPSLIIILSSRF